MEKYKIDSDPSFYNSESVLDFINGVWNGTVKQYFKSEPTPLVQDNLLKVSTIFLLKKVVANNFKELVEESEVDFFLEVGAKWCTHCRNVTL